MSELSPEQRDDGIYIFTGEVGARRVWPHFLKNGRLNDDYDATNPSGSASGRRNYQGCRYQSGRGTDPILTAPDAKF